MSACNEVVTELEQTEEELVALLLVFLLDVQSQISISDFNWGKADTSKFMAVQRDLLKLSNFGQLRQQSSLRGKSMLPTNLNSQEA